MIEPDDEGRFVGRVFEMPGVMADGRTQTECLASLMSAASLTVATILEDGEAPPLPCSEVGRREQVNIRLTPEEKVLLTRASAHGGFKGLSEFVRTIVLHAVVGRAG